MESVVAPKQKFPRAEAIAVAKQICDALKPVTQRLVVAGSLRRRKLEVADVEILYVPMLAEQQNSTWDLFLAETINHTDRAIAQLESDGVLARRLNVKGSEIYGDYNKLMTHVASGIPVDFFSTTLENWWVSLVIRTGSKEMNLALTTSARKQGRTLHAYGAGTEDFVTGKVTPATSEQHVFELCGVPYREPWER